MLRLPAKHPSHKSPKLEAQMITIGGIYYHKLTNIICMAFVDSLACKFHYTPFHLFCKLSPNLEPECVYTELYNSDTFLKEHKKLQKQTCEPGCKLNQLVATMMLWSDSTHLASFGNTSLWHIYCYFGNQSKYSHAKLSNYAAHHIVYIPSLPDTVREQYIMLLGYPPSLAVLTHLKSELMHAIWRLILNNEFLHSYKHGIVVSCTDGNEQCLHPHILMYLADYPEKVLLSTIQYLGQCPCPHCFILKWEIDGINTESDVKHTYVENLLKPTSMVPTCNAFSECLLDLGFEFHEVFVPNLLHKFKLGVWKAVFMHLL
ncbi:hypothetical protein P691DRAFT_799461 [Macrolepiota fuliginosa MF-IS2]|uniref:Uncharacterized protein n=1 Tax=Macrolepiota fuliginosa MF-IS2 TaxID=1400762 RepID=A0A9P6BXI0_9AGAR|nr:hypothetical protein P691DRAFT_799461 [Macrolepiota fuliginosa MF-IS2]